MRKFATIIAGAALLTGGLQAQTEPKEKLRFESDVLKAAGPKDTVYFERHAIGTGPDTVEFISTEGSIAGKVVKGAPYSAEAVTETSQTLSDGNRIARKSTAATYRDTEGRTRRDMTLPAIGPFAATGDAPSFIMINDPVAGISYHLDSKSKTARKLPGMPGSVGFGPGIRVIGGRVSADGKTQTTGAAADKAAMEKMMAEKDAEKGAVIGIQGSVQASPAFQIRTGSGAEPKSESLGKQVIEGIEVEGTRSTMTIPAGEIGNEREISIVNERWYSPELQTVVMSKNSDPRMGETVYKLTNIKRGDPHPSLFQIPSDYTVVAEDAPMRFMRKIDTK